MKIFTWNGEYFPSISCFRRLTESFSLAFVAWALEEAGLWITWRAAAKFDLGTKAKHSDLAMLDKIAKAIFRMRIHSGSDPGQ